MADSAPASADPPAPLPLLNRPASQRRQEFKYRLGQSVVFGLPVLALAKFGRSLGGVEADRWVSLLQALLAGWVVYVGATGMVAEGILLLLGRRPLRGQFLGNLIVGAAALVIYLLGLPRLVSLLSGNSRIASNWPHAFPWAVVIRKKSRRPASQRSRLMGRILQKCLRRLGSSVSKVHVLFGRHSNKRPNGTEAS